MKLITRLLIVCMIACLLPMAAAMKIIVYSATGQTRACRLVRRTDQKIYNATDEDFEAAAGTWAQQLITMTEDTNVGYTHYASADLTIPAGVHLCDCLVYDGTPESTDSPIDGFKIALAGTADTEVWIGNANVAYVGETAQTANDNGADINAILTDTNELQTDDVPALIATAQADLDTITGTGGALIATDAMDRSGTLDVNTKTITDGIITAAKLGADAITNAKIADSAIAAENIASNAITAAKIADGAIDNATFAADVGSTAYATNIIALAVRKVLDELNLDHLLAVADNNDVVYNSVMAKIAASDANWIGYDYTTYSLEAIKNEAGGVPNID